MLSLLALVATTLGAPSVLFVGGVGSDLATRLAASGLALDSAGLPEGKPLTFDQLRRYNVVVVEGLGRSNADMSLNAVNTASVEALRQYLAAGGGVLLTASFGQMATAKPPQDAFLKPLGLTPLFEEAAYDPPASVVATPWKIAFAKAGPLAAHPINQGVTTVWYPVPTHRIGAQNHTTPLLADQGWTVLLTGSDTSLSRSGPLQADPPTQPGHFQRNVPIAAGRQVGPGRLVCLAITPEYLFGANASTTLEGIVLDRGLAGLPSDGQRWLTNALAWLAAPSAAGGATPDGVALGGAPHNKRLEEDPRKTRFGQTFRWTDQVAWPAVEPALPGVIGARSAASSGQGSVAEWVAAAKAAGLAYLVFLEEFAKLTPRAFAQLKADCAQATTPTFAAVPGFTIDDEVGNHYFYCGPTLDYPRPDFLSATGASADGTRFVSRDPQVDAKNPHLKGQLAMTTLDYAYSLGSFRLTAGNYLLSKSAAPFADFYSNWDAFGLLTADAGRVVEDGLASYLQLVAVGEGPLPMAIDRLTAPAQLAATPLRTVLRLPAKGGSLIGQELTAERKIGDYLSEWHFYPDNPAKIYVTDGPEIECWRYRGPRDYEGNLDGDFVWPNYRWQLNGRAKSAAGLAEVTVYDGERAFRRYRPGGVTEYEVNLDLTHDRQHNLVLVAVDRQGRRAVSGEQWDRNHRLEEFMCADRNNQLSYGYSTNSAGLGMLLGGNQSLGTPIKRIQSGISPSGTFRNDPLLGAPAFDGAAGGEPEVWDSVALLTEGGEVAGPNLSQSRRLLMSGDLNLGESHREHRFADNIAVHNVWHTLWRTEPSPDLIVNRRNAFFQVDPDSPVAVFWWSIDLTLKRDLPNRGVRIATLGPGETSRWMAIGSDGQRPGGDWGKERGPWVSVPFEPGACIAMLDSPLGSMAVFPLTSGLEAGLASGARGQAQVTLKGAATPQKAGQTAHVELLLVGLPRPTILSRSLPADSAQAVEQFRAGFGLEPSGVAGYKLLATAGKLISQRARLRLDGSAEGCFSGQLAGTLLSSLPIEVAGLNDNASAFLYDRRRRQARPIGVFEGAAWATVPLRGETDLFIGHPVTASQRALVIQVTQSGDRQWRVEVHNPTDQPIRADLTVNRHFDPWAGKTLPPVSVPAGQSVWLDL